MKLISWNVNGLRAAAGKGFADAVAQLDADVVCLQETKLQPGQIDLPLPGYRQYWHSAEKKGYSGTAAFTRALPLSVRTGLYDMDSEGRVMTLDMGGFYLVNVYTPNSQDGLKRLPFRMAWDDAFRAYAAALDAEKPDAPETKRLLGELSQALRRAEDARDALEAVDEAERRLLAMQQRTAGDALNALNGAGLNALAQALGNEDRQTAQDALEAQENAAAALDQAAQTAGDASAADALSSAAASMQAGDVSQAAQQLMNAASGQTSATAQAMALAGMVRNATASAGMQTANSGQGGQNGQGSGGNGVSQSQGKGNGGGAGLGSSNQDGGTGANSKPGNMQGNADPSKKTGAYETIYDPTRLGGSGEAVSETGEMGEGTISEAQIGAGLGTIDGSVPYGQALPEYERQAVEAVQNAALPEYARQWVTDYFRALE